MESFGCEAEDLSQDFLTFDVDRAKCLPDHRCKRVLHSFEVLVVLAMFLSSGVLLARFKQPYASFQQWARHRYIDRQAAPFTPDG